MVLAKLYVPKVLSKIQNVPVPRFIFLLFFFRFTFLTFSLSRTEYKDDDVEFVFENLDISSYLPISSLHMPIYATSPMLVQKYKFPKS